VSGVARRVVKYNRNNNPYAGWVRNTLAENGSWVVGPNQGPTPPDLSSHSLFQWRRERESLVYAFFFVSTTPCKWSSTEVLWQVVKSTCFSIVYLLVIKEHIDSGLFCGFLPHLLQVASELVRSLHKIERICTKKQTILLEHLTF